MGANTFTFSTGIKIQLKRVSPFLVAELRKAHPPPEPPMQEVDYGDGQKRAEPNPAHPDYVKALDAYETDIRERQMRYVVRQGVVLEEPDAQMGRAPAWKAQVDALRAQWHAEQGAELSEQDDALAYVQFICIGSGEEYAALINAISGHSQPTEEAIKAEAASFRSQVQGD